MMRVRVPHSGAPLSRRDFLLASGTTMVAAGCGRFAWPGTSRYDVIIRGGFVVDGTGAEGAIGDVAVAGGLIAAMAGTVSGSASEEIDARGLAVAPGFVDIHSHADGTLFDDPRAESVIRQGVTTVVVGQDGSSRGPAPEGEAESAVARLRRAAGMGSRFASIHDFLRATQSLPSAVNVASMVGLGTIRSAIVGDVDRPATASELRRMVGLVRGALSQGACGASSGLEYVPGAFASRDELVALCRPLAARRLPYATHLRNEDDQLLEAMEEAIAIARDAGCPLQISHLKTQGPRNWGKIDAALSALEAAHASGVDAAFDRYPYEAYQTTLANLFPTWSRDGGSAAFVARLADSTIAPRLRDAVAAKVESIGGWENVMISSVRNESDRSAEGMRMAERARASGADPYDATVALLRASEGDVGMVGFAMSEQNTTRFLTHPRGMVASDGAATAIDGPARRGRPHPRSLGTFPRVLARYVREQKALTLSQAIHKMTAFPASRVHLAGRGRLVPGAAADVVVFDPARVQDRASYTDPFQYPDGITAVLVNGSIALRDGERSERRTGRALRPSDSANASPLAR